MIRVAFEEKGGSERRRGMRHIATGGVKRAPSLRDVSTLENSLAWLLLETGHSSHALSTDLACIWCHCSSEVDVEYLHRRCRLAQRNEPGSRSGARRTALATAQTWPLALEKCQARCGRSENVLVCVAGEGLHASSVGCTLLLVCRYTMVRFSDACGTRRKR